MRRCVLVLLASIATTLPSIADTPAEQLNIWREVTFTAPIPCTVVCPYWLDMTNTDVDGNGSEDIWFQACGNPSGTADALEDAPKPIQRGTVYDDVLVGPAPEGAAVLIFDSTPAVDWDTFICSLDGEELANGANILGEHCGGPLGPQNPVPTGCRERAVTLAAQGVEYILRAYNWSDPLPLRARYCFSRTGVCSPPSTGRFEALPCGVACTLPDGHACGAPLASWGYDEVRVTAPPGSSVMTVRIDPVVDWDMFVCHGAVERAVGANILGEPCDNALAPQNPAPVGCTERVIVPVMPGQIFTVRAFNIADPFPAPYQVGFQ